MRRTFAYFISSMIFLSFIPDQAGAQDTILIPLKIKVGFELSGPAIHFSEKDIFNMEGYISADINERLSAILCAGHLNYRYSQYNYEYHNKGAFIRSGIDLNLLEPEKSRGKYYAGVGFRYGLSLFNSEVPMFKQDNYWGTTTSAVAPATKWGHFIEASPGVRAEVFRNLSIGWNLSIRMLLYTGTGKSLRPIYFPGFGNGGKSFSTGINYFVVWNIPYKKINVIIKKEVPEEEEDTEEEGSKQQQSSIRQ